MENGIATDGADEMCFMETFFAWGWPINGVVETLPTWLTPATAYGIGILESSWLVERVVSLFCSI